MTYLDKIDPVALDQQQSIASLRIRLKNKAFVSQDETTELRAKLKSLLSEEDAFAIDPDRRTAEKILKIKRRFTRAEADFVNTIYCNYLLWKKRKEKKKMAEKAETINRFGNHHCPYCGAKLIDKPNRDSKPVSAAPATEII